MRNAYNEAKSLRKQIKEKINSKLELNPELKNKYSKITEGYRKEVVPYKNVPAINEYKWGDLSHSDLVSNLLNTKKGKTFLLKEGSKYPELGLQKLMQNPFISKLLEGAALGTGALGVGLGGYGAYDYYNRQNQNP